MDEDSRPVSSYEYETDRLILLPYDKTATATFREEFLPLLYLRLKEEKTLDLIFPGMGMGHMNDFVAYMRNAAGFVVPSLKMDGKVLPVGLGWLAEVDGPVGARKGSFGFGFFKEMWVNRERVRWHVDLSTLMLAYWFEECKCEILYGTSINPKALNYSRRFGFSKPYRLPKFFSRGGVLTDAHVIYLEREAFRRYYSHWRSLMSQRGNQCGRTEGTKPKHAEYRESTDAREYQPCAEAAG